jgi:hypothetical protein
VQRLHVDRLGPGHARTSPVEDRELQAHFEAALPRLGVLLRGRGPEFEHFDESGGAGEAQRCGEALGIELRRLDVQAPGHGARLEFLLFVFAGR